ncbi:MAG TPA: arylsulfatase [Verrucomicrobia bacterium]|nr:arylsulfatase [Verrucomicrobiota bacterium]
MFKTPIPTHLHPVCFALLISLMSLNLQAADRPNIIIILSDDMGYSDIGCYGGEINTPTLDGLAKGGLRFTQFYNTGRCCPTRASLLTGLYPHQTGIGHMMNDRGVDGYRGDLNASCVTIAQALKPAGYSNSCLGKWHVTKNTFPKNVNEKYNWPLQRGFDRYYGIINGASSLWDPNSLTRDNKPITIRNDPEYQPEEPYHFTDAISDNAVNFINHHSASKPFFMYVAYTAAHWPMHARPKDIANYEGKYDRGYGPIRNARFNRMKAMGVITSDTELSSLVGDWNAVPDKEWEAACMEVYAAMIDQMDQGIGRIVKALKAKGTFENTLILFMQDNGGCAEAGGRKPRGNRNPRADKPALPPIPDDLLHYQGSVPKQTRDGYPVRRGHVMPGPADTYIGYGRNWANVSNTPFREYKHYVHEGGISTPLIAHWPRGIKAKNELRSEPSHLIDLMATCVDLSGANYPTEFKGKTIKPMEGKSLLSVFEGKSLDRKRIFFEHEGNRALRIGDWKIVAKGRHGQDNVDWELYHITEDRAELHNLADDHTERLKRMKALWVKKAALVQATPWANTNRNKK